MENFKLELSKVELDLVYYVITNRYDDNLLLSNEDEEILNHIADRLILTKNGGLR